MFKELEIMKTNNTVINSIMNNEVNRTFMVKKSFLKYICAVLMIIGTSVHAWGTGIFLEYNSTKYYDGDMVTINLAQTTLPAHGSPSMAVKNDAGWTQDGAYRYGIITTTLSGASVPSNVSFLMGSYAASVGTPVGDDDETSYYTHNPSAQYWNASFQLGYYFAAAGTYDVTMTVTEKDQADGTTVLQSATITIRFVVTFSGYTITYNLTGLEHANPYNPTATSGEFHAEFELADNYSTPITGTYSDGFVTNAPITIGTSGDCYYNLGDLYYNSEPEGNITINLTATLTCTPLAAPGSLTLSQNHDATHGKTRFGWNSVANASGYKVTVSNGVTTASVTTASDRYYYIATFPTGNYTWSVKAIGDGSTYCEENDATDGTPFCVGADLSAVTPSNLAASEVTNTTATISWDAVANAAGYELLIVDDEETAIDDYSGSGTSWDVTGLTAGTTYTIWWQTVNSCDDEYNSDIDKSVSFTTTNNHTVSFNANGGSGSMDAVVRTHGTTYDLPGCTFVAPSGKVFKCWAEGSAGGTERAVGYTHTVNADITFYAKWRDAVITDYVFSCSELTLTPVLATAGTPIFITSATNKTVRSQDKIQIVGSGLTPSTALTFPGLNSKYEIKKADGTALETDGSGAITADAYIFYTPGEGDTSDGLDQMAGITVSVGGAKPKQVSLVQSIIGRHLPADFVIAAKNTNNNKWYALPADFSDEQTPAPIEIAVDDINNPSVAYTANTNIYNLYGQNSGAGYLYNDGDDDGNPDGEKIKLGMKNNGNKPLFAFAGTKSSLKGDGAATVTNNINKQYWWTLTQTATSIENPQDAKYIIASSNNSKTMSAWFNTTPQKWGLFAGGNGEHTLRLIPARNVVPTEAYFVEWAQHGGVIEVDAEGVGATSVVAHLGEATSEAITLVQTKASDAKNKSSKYNYTVNFGGSIDFAAAASNGALLTLEWKNGETVKAVSNIVVPKIVASNITINKENYPLKSDWNTEVHVLPGKTVTVDPSAYDGSNVTIKELNIYPGATVVASTGTLIASNLVLRNGWSRAGEKTYDVARLYVTASPSTATLKATNVYADWYIDYDQYYPVAVPWNATVANFTYRYSSVAPTVGHDKNIRLRYYDGNSRATNVQEGVGSGANWKLYGAEGCTPVPETLTPSTGYAMTAKRPTGKAFSIIRMPLTLPSGTWGDGTWTTNGEAGNISTTHKDQVAVTAYGVKDKSETAYAEGWNLIANPYMSIYQGTIEYADETKVQYVNIPDVDFKEYNQLATATAKLAPSSAFLIQAPKTGTITFGTAKRVASAPSFRVEENPASTPEQQAYIVLNNEQSEDMMGILVSDKYTADYEINADLEKLLGDGTSLRTYMRYGNMNMAYVAINEMLAKEWIPVTVRIPESGEYTYSLHDASIAGELEGVYLIDYQNGDKVTNLIEQSYTFSSTAGTINGRFAINAKAGERQTPTGIDAINAGGDINSDKPFKFIYHDKVYIWINGIIYDTTGKRVK